MSWMYELSDRLHAVSGAAEILGGLGLILPGLARIRRLTMLAALGLIVVMVAAIIWHTGRGEMANTVTNVINALVLAYIAYGRWKVAPLSTPRSPVAP